MIREGDVQNGGMQVCCLRLYYPGFEGKLVLGWHGILFGNRNTSALTGNGH